MKKNKAFTLIELIAVLVILAILALIVTPLVLNIIRKARTAADRRSIDAYGRSIELSIASYLLDTGTFPASVEQLTIEYTGDEVVCSTTQLNSDSSVYLSGCTVAGRNVDYSYGTDRTTSFSTYKSYSVGDEVSYNNVNYYVIAESGPNESTVTLLKAEPLTVEEVNEYGGVGTDNNHVNKYATNSQGVAYDQNGYGNVAFYTSESCMQPWDVGCTNNYNLSDVKYIVDAWSERNVPVGLQEARLITKDEYVANCIEENRVNDSGAQYVAIIPQYSWMYNSDYNYFTSSPEGDAQKIFNVLTGGGIISSYVSSAGTSGGSVIRPVIVLNKSYLSNE